MEAKEKILNSAEELFIQYGIRSVTMDDVAREASMSKKTLYQYFDNKDGLVSEVALNHFEKETKEFEEIYGQSNDSIHEILLVSQCLRKHVFRMNPSLLYDMQKYHGKAWDNYQEFKHSTIRGHIERNIERGKEEGYFREDLDAKVLSILRVEGVQLVFNTKIFPREEYDFPTVQLQILDHFVHGLLTDKGRKKYEEYINLESTNHIL
ncbi:TetR/AcrR family transcriptional regulator [Ekhidna sp. To15]|uniref:TetR/AcrR family transcriptional regulator n=1 Tax=Ekhidna sp. To15 TaxID=3395267 RepID=UPI003F52696F